MKTRRPVGGRIGYDARQRSVAVSSVVVRADDRSQRGVVESVTPAYGPDRLAEDSVLTVAWAERDGCWVEDGIPAEDVIVVGRTEKDLRCEGETRTRYGSWGGRWRPPKVGAAVWRDARRVASLWARRRNVRPMETTPTGARMSARAQRVYNLLQEYGVHLTPYSTDQEVLRSRTALRQILAALEYGDIGDAPHRSEMARDLRRIMARVPEARVSTDADDERPVAADHDTPVLPPNPNLLEID